MPPKIVFTTWCGFQSIITKIDIAGDRLAQQQPASSSKGLFLFYLFLSFLHMLSICNNCLVVCYVYVYLITMLLFMGCRQLKVRGTTITWPCCLAAQTMILCRLLSSNLILVATSKSLDYNPIISMHGKIRCRFNQCKLFHYKFHTHTSYKLIVVSPLTIKSLAITYKQIAYSLHVILIFITKADDEQ